MVAFAYEDCLLGSLLSALFVTSVINWSKVYLMSYVKLADIIIAILTITYISFFKDFNPFWTAMWNNVIWIAIVVFVYNSLVFYEIGLKGGTPEIYIAHVAIHITFLHIAPTMVCMFALASYHFDLRTLILGP